MIGEASIEALRGQRVLVTGGSGFLGRPIVAAAERAGAVVIAPPFPEFNVQDAAAVEAVALQARPSVIIHAAGLPDWRRDPLLTIPMMQVHAMGTAHVLEAARKVGVARIVLVGSAGEYGATPAPQREVDVPVPMDAYSVSKVAATELGRTYDRAFDVPCTIVRPFNIYGPGEGPRRLLPSIFALAAQGGGELPMTTGEQIRDFVFVEDVAEGILRAAVNPKARGEILNLGRGEGVRVRDLAMLASEIASSGVSSSEVTAETAAPTGRSGRRAGVVRPVFGATPLRGPEPPALVADMSHTRAILGWVPPTSLAAGLQRFWASFRAASDAASSSGLRA